MNSCMDQAMMKKSRTEDSAHRRRGRELPQGIKEKMMMIYKIYQ
jgi:hypothetical protein